MTWDSFAEGDKVVIDTLIDKDSAAWGHIICLGTDGCTVRNPENGQEYEVCHPADLIKPNK